MNATHAHSHTTSEVDYRLARADQVRERAARGFAGRSTKIPVARTETAQQQVSIIARWLRQGTATLAAEAALGPGQL